VAIKAVEVGLTDAQRTAITHARGPLLIVAGAGAGKTRVLVERYRRLRQEGVPAETILLLTFTEKAAREILDRVEHQDALPTGERSAFSRKRAGSAACRKGFGSSPKFASGN
jgi:superfamily I DNA/RNA helicase